MLEMLGKITQEILLILLALEEFGLQEHFISHVRKGRWEMLFLLAVKGLSSCHSILHSSWMHKAYNQVFPKPTNSLYFQGA